MRVTIGVDVGKEQHVAAAYDATTQRPLGQRRFAVERAGFDAFLTWVEQLGSHPDEVLIGVEATGHYHITLANCVRERGYAVVVLNPYQVPNSGVRRGGSPRPTGLMPRRSPASWPARRRPRCPTGRPTLGASPRCAN